jgi:hypothetical protein
MRFKTDFKGDSAMKKLTLILILTVALVGCGRETEQIEVDATQIGEDVRTLTLAWNKVSEDDGSICDLSTSTYESVKEAHAELSKALAPHGVEVAVKTLTPERVEGGLCQCNRVLIQDRFVDEWLGAELVKTSCSGCPNSEACAKTAGSGVTCGGQTAMLHQGKSYDIIPANLIVMAGMVAAADLTGEEIAYSGCACAGACEGKCTCGKCGEVCRVDCVCSSCKGDCKCGKCADGCVHHTAGAECSPDCPGVAAGSTAPCHAAVAGAAEKTASATAKAGCPGSAGCKSKGCAAASGR